MHNVQDACPGQLGRLVQAYVQQTLPLPSGAFILQQDQYSRQERMKACMLTHARMISLLVNIKGAPQRSDNHPRINVKKKLARQNSSTSGWLANPFETLIAPLANTKHLRRNRALHINHPILQACMHTCRCVSLICVKGVVPPPWCMSTWPFDLTFCATSSVRCPLYQSSSTTMLS
jgi:hypothetical protein